MADTLRRQQFALARHLRDPDAYPPPPGIEERRLRIYRELFLNNIDSLLAGNFPVIRRTLDDDAWRTLVRDFHARHRSRTPLFPEIGREFIRFLENRADQGSDDPPWLLELAHYEWIELALQLADDEVPAHDPHGDLLAGVPLPSPFARALAYRWPVHRIGPGFAPQAPPTAPTLILARRDAAGEVRFAEISPLVYRLLELLGDAAPRSGRQRLEGLAAESGTTADDGFIAQGTALLLRMREEGTLLGTRPPGVAATAPGPSPR
ncbi:putative DNA-binding domain-containing protein [Flavobacterium sp. MXW15]|uniref:DNA-binding domain-containing protein n=1 Tax=Xanthomonas chitinilytica TaxID=2989819 RepID=A0ABT3JR88_9XANT|nr:putative DNA-binding domain-containing protein [Xanthomonas sp. H13-6]MCW4453278.1 putative DNA-binding domain-containing protein [Flavobacterium sp. MXW15]MCW4470991.1 putative DNA-binding domain-containing protein [Xanthomonas sp. H13-6]